VPEVSVRGRTPRRAASRGWRNFVCAAAIDGCTLLHIGMEHAPAEVHTERAYDKYTPIAELGQGGTANVYLAVSRGLDGFNKLVVLKVLKNELAEETEFRRMFTNEARLAARLNHPNVVQTNEILQINGRPLIVMEYLEGQPLSRLIARTRDPDYGTKLDLYMHLRILLEALSGLHYSHELADYDGKPLNVVHRDFTPQNVFVSYDGRVCVLDFGIAKLAGNGPETMTGAGVVKGKLRYMPTEQLLATGIDRRADIFAMGVMLWEAATGERMWHGMSDAQIMNNVINNRIPRPRDVNPACPEELERIVMKALAYDREDRYPSAADMQAELENFVGQKAPTTRAVGKFVNDLFTDDRAQLRTLIERQLANLGEQSSGLETLIQSRLPVVSFLPRAQQTGTGSVSRQAPTAPTQLGSRGRRRRAITIGVGAALLAVALLAWWSFRPRPAEPELVVAAAPAQEAQTGAAQAAPAPVAPPVPQEISLRISVLPATAQLFLDDRPLSSNPYTTTLPKSADEHTIRAEAPGFTPVLRRITYLENANVELTLEAEKPKAPRRTKAKPDTAAAPAEAAPAAVDCSVPYYLDERGVRRIRRECLSK
jgi:serine/threonine protein kinase